MKSVESSALEPSLSVADIYANARALGDFLREKTPEIEQARRLPPDVAARVRDAGMFRITMPKSWGGPELSPVEQVEVVEELAKANASVAWCVMIGCDSGLFSGYLDDAAARELYPRLDMATAGMAPPVGRADRVDGGYRINGQWSFGSGITHADVVSAGCIIFKNGGPEMLNEKIPRWRLMLAPASSYEIQDVWHTTGLRGTGSNDYRAADMFVPERHSLSFLDPKRDGPLWRRADNILHKAAGVPLGAARSAIDFFCDAMQGKVEMPGGQLYKNQARVQTAIADAEMILGAARSYVFSSLERHWERVQKREKLTDRERAHVWLSRVNVCHAAREVIRLLYDAVGSAAIYSGKGPLDRALRDSETWCQHIVAQRRSLEWVGAVLLKADNAGTNPLF
jgi:alkylation response protein AidB-like acyl-CoA dehydrogenase